MVLTLDHQIVISADKAALASVVAELAKNDIRLGRTETLSNTRLRRVSVTGISITPSCYGLRDIDVAVLRFLADGLTFRALGLLLGMSEDSAKTCGRRILRTLGARDKAHAVYLAYRRGILGVDASQAASSATSEGQAR